MWEFNEFRDNLLDKENASQVTELPKLAFLDGLEAENDQDSLILASYPRSGNTLLRKYLENITGLVTGSDMALFLENNKVLMEAGLQGEGIMDKRVWVIKTHFPEASGIEKFGAERAILLVRNPLDCIVSYFNLHLTGSHSTTVDE